MTSCKNRVKKASTDSEMVYDYTCITNRLSDQGAIELMICRTNDHLSKKWSVESTDFWTIYLLSNKWVVELKRCQTNRLSGQLTV